MSATIVGPGRQAAMPLVRAPRRSFSHYHDTEWGFPVDDDHRLFEKLCLEGFQSGLSWRTILAKRENFRAAFHDFDFDRIARFTQRDVERLLKDEGIVRHRGKIEAVINNARTGPRTGRAGRVAGGFHLALRTRRQAAGRHADGIDVRRNRSRCRRISRSRAGSQGEVESG